MAVSYYVHFIDDDPVLVYGPYELKVAKDFARIGSIPGKSRGGRRAVYRGSTGMSQCVRVYDKGIRVWPKETEQLEQLRKSEHPKALHSHARPSLVENPKDATVAMWLMVLKSKLTQWDKREFEKEMKRSGRGNIYRLSHLLGAAQETEAALKKYLNRDDKEALDRFEEEVDAHFTPGFSPIKNVKKQLTKYRETGKMPSLVG